MALIKRADTAQMAREAVTLDLGDLARQADLLKRRAREQAGAIMADARAQRERLISTAAQEGHAQGHTQGLEEGRAQGVREGRDAALEQFREQLRQLHAAWSQALEQFQSQRDSMLLEARQDVLRLAVEMGEKVTKRRIELDPGVVQDQLAAVLALLARPTRLIVAVHPDDRTAADEAIPDLLEAFANAQHIELKPDPALDRGSVIARCDGGAGRGAARGRIDASIRTQLDRIVEILLPGEDAPRDPSSAQSTPEDPPPTEPAA